MRALFASPLGLLVGLSLGALGAGGSLLAVPLLVYVAGEDPRAATTTSLFLVGTAALVGIPRHWRAGRVQLGTGIAFGLAGIGGSLAGSALNRHIDPDLLLLGFSFLVLLAAWRMRVGCPTCTSSGEARTLRRTEPASGEAGGTIVDSPPRLRLDAGRVAAVLITGTAVGFLTGLFGVGGGFVVVPALALVMKLPMPQAIGTSLVVIAINSAVALSSRVANTGIDWDVAIPFTASAIVGVLVGGRLADRIDAERSLRWFSIVLVAVGVYTALRAGLSLAAG